MRATLPLALCALTLLAACGRQHSLFSETAPARTIYLRNPATGAPSYVGRWAATAAACADRAWILTTVQIEAPTGLSCTIVKLDPGSAGYSGDVVCGDPARRKAGRMSLTLSGQGASRGLTLEGDALPMPMSLTACPPATVATVPPAPASAAAP